MAEPLKNRFGADIPARIAAAITAVHPGFPREAFVEQALAGFEPLDLMARGRHLAQVLRRHLPPSYEGALEILLASLGPRLETGSNGMAPFFYLPHVELVAQHGLGHFEPSMRALHQLTQRFTAEFSIRPFIEAYPEASLARLHEWVSDPSPHVRRLVSEGTRPRLPWAARLRRFQKDPRPVLELLERLKDDPELYVRRSVANNLNDIGKDHPQLLAETARRWLNGASPERHWLVRHALRSAVKRGEAGALEVLGFGGAAELSLRAVRISPPRVAPDQAVVIEFELHNATGRSQSVLVDFRVFFVKASGRASPKVFKLKRIELVPGARVALRKTVSLAPMTTRKHYPGRHAVELLLNGKPQPLGEFELLGR